MSRFLAISIVVAFFPAMFLGIWLESLGARDGTQYFYWEHLAGRAVSTILGGIMILYSGFAALHSVQYVASPINRAGWLLATVVFTMFGSCVYFCTEYQRFRKEGRGGLIAKPPFAQTEVLNPDERNAVNWLVGRMRPSITITLAVVLFALMVFAAGCQAKAPFCEVEWPLWLHMAFNFFMAIAVVSYCGFAALHAVQHSRSPYERAGWTLATIGLHVIGACFYYCVEFQRAERNRRGRSYSPVMPAAQGERLDR